MASSGAAVESVAGEGFALWLLVALASLPLVAALAAIEAWNLPAQLRRLYDLSYELPPARFVPPTIQVLVPVWLGTPEATQAKVAVAIHLSRPNGGWPLAPGFRKVVTPLI